MVSKEPPLRVQPSPEIAGWLSSTRRSLAFTTYQTNRLFMIGTKSDGSLSVFERLFDRPMGLYATPEQLIMSTRWQLWWMENALETGTNHNGFDRLYIPQTAKTTGAINVHDIAVDGDGNVIFVNTAYSCLAIPSGRHSFRPVWKPPFISKLAPEDRCHLNGLAMRDGRPAYVTVVSRSDKPGGWRDSRRDGGCVLDVASGEVVVSGLSMPHSPRVYGGRLWVLNSGTGELGIVDVEQARFEPVASVPGFARGLAFAGDYAVVGLSKQRQDKTFQGLDLDDRLRANGTEACCGLWVIDLRTGKTAHSFLLDGVVIELYDVQVLEGVIRPQPVGFRNDEIQRFIGIEHDKGVQFTAHRMQDVPDGKQPRKGGGAPR